MSEDELRDLWSTLRDRAFEATVADAERALELIEPETGPGLAAGVLGSVEDVAFDERAVRRALLDSLPLFLDETYDPAVRERAAEVVDHLATMYDKAIAEADLAGHFVDLLEDEDPEMRRWGADCLSTLAANHHVAGDALVAASVPAALSGAVGDPDPDVRRWVVIAAGTALAETDLDSENRLRCFRTVRTGVTDDAPAVRETATGQLERAFTREAVSAPTAETEGAVDALVERLDDESDEVVTAACEALGRFATQLDEGPACLERAGATGALVDVLERAADPPAQAEVLSKPVEQAAGALGDVGSADPALVESAIPRLRALRDPDSTRGHAIFEAFGEIASRNPEAFRPVVEEFRAVLKDGSVEEQIATATNLGSVGWEAPGAVEPAIDSLVALLAADDAEVRVTAANAVCDVAYGDTTLVADALDPLLDALLAAPWNRSERCESGDRRSDDRVIAKTIREIARGDPAAGPTEVIERVVTIATTAEEPKRQRRATRVLWAYVAREFTHMPYAGDTALIDSVRTADVFDPVAELLSHPDGLVRTRAACILLRVRPVFSAAAPDAAREVVRARLRCADPVPDDACWQEERPDRKSQLQAKTLWMLGNVVRWYPDRIEPLEPAIEAAADESGPVVPPAATEVLEDLRRQ